MKKSLGIAVISILCVTIFLAAGLFMINKYKLFAPDTETVSNTVESTDETENEEVGAENTVDAIVHTTEIENDIISMEEVAKVIEDTDKAETEAGAEANAEKAGAGTSTETDAGTETGAETEIKTETKTETEAGNEASEGGAAENAEETSLEGEAPEETVEPEVAAYLADSVIIGDSVVLGYRNYCRKSQDETLKAIQFLAAGSFSAHNAMWPVSDKSVHPLYQGQQRPIWESVSMMGAGNVFICFGLNDLNIDDKTCEYYQQVLEKILESSPEVQIHIISMTYTLKDQGKGRLNNDEIRIYNGKLQEMAVLNGWGYVDIASLLADEEGNLAPEYCSDGFLHQNPAAYQIWSDELKRYVREWLHPADAENVAE